MCGGENCEMARVVLKVDDNWRYNGFYFDHVERRVYLRLAHVRGRRHDCPDCGAPDQPVHDIRPRKWRHLHVGAYQCYIEAGVPRVKCGECGKVLMAEVPWARPKSRMTRQMEALLMSQCKRSAIRGVALEYDVSDYRIWHALKQCVDKAREKADHFGVQTEGTQKI